MLYYVRHGQSSNNQIQLEDPDNYEQIRSINPGISDKGILQVRLAAYALKQYAKVDEIQCSPFKRAILSALIMQEQFNVPVRVVQDIYEVGGCYFKQQSFPGSSREEIQKEFPGVIIDDRITDRWCFHQQRETRAEALIRAKELIKKLPQDKNIIMIGHGNLMDLILGIILERSPDSTVKYIHQNSSITTIANIDNTVKLQTFNDYTHLKIHQAQTGQNLIDDLLDNEKV